jgi:hypothetical protein
MRQSRAAGAFTGFTCGAISFDEAMGAALAELEKIQTGNELGTRNPAQPLTQEVHVYSTEQPRRKGVEATTHAAADQSDGESKKGSSLVEQPSCPRRASVSPLSRTFSTSADRMKLGVSLSTLSAASVSRCSPVPHKFQAAPACNVGVKHAGASVGSNNTSLDHDSASCEEKDTAQKKGGAHIFVEAPAAADHQKSDRERASSLHLLQDRFQESFATANDRPDCKPSADKLRALVAGLRVRACLCARPIADLRSQLRDLAALMADAASREEHASSSSGEDSAALSRAALAAQQRLWRQQLCSKLAEMIGMSASLTQRDRDSCSMAAYLYNKQRHTQRDSRSRSVPLAAASEVVAQIRDIAVPEQPAVSDRIEDTHAVDASEGCGLQPPPPGPRKMLRKGSGSLKYGVGRVMTEKSGTETVLPNRLGAIADTKEKDHSSETVVKPPLVEAGAASTARKKSGTRSMSASDGPFQQEKHATSSTAATERQSERQLERKPKSEERSLPRRGAGGPSTQSSESSLSQEVLLVGAARSPLPQPLPVKGAFSRVAALSAAGANAPRVQEFSSDSSKQRAAQIVANLRSVVAPTLSNSSHSGNQNGSELARLLDDAFLAKRRQDFFAALFANPDGENSNVPRLDASQARFVFEAAASRYAHESRCSLECLFQYRELKSAVESVLSARP